VRHGLTPRLDLGAEIAGSMARAQVRGRLGRVRLARFIGGASAHVGLAQEDARAVRVGGSVPFVIGFDLLSVFEVWLGVRAAVDYLGGTSELGTSLDLITVRTGGVVGMAVGFRRVHLLVELGIDHELWLGNVNDSGIERGGLVLTPAFALRIRL
jgi:hypothetical protein